MNGVLFCMNGAPFVSVYQCESPASFFYFFRYFRPFRLAMLIFPPWTVNVALWYVQVTVDCSPGATNWKSTHKRNRDHSTFDFPLLVVKVCGLDENGTLFTIRFERRSAASSVMEKYGNATCCLCMIDRFTCECLSHSVIQI